MGHRVEGELFKPLSLSRLGSGSPFVFLHGLGASRGQAEASMREIPGVELIAVDLPGHGDSASSPIEPSFESFAEAVLALLDEHDISTAIVGGISMGSGIALRLALIAPERVRALVLVRPAWTDEPGRPHLDIVSDIGEWVLSHGIEGARKRLFDDDRYRTMAANEPRAAASVAKAIDGVVATERPDVLSAMVDSHPVDDLADLAAIEQPALVISTEHDRLHPTHIAASVTAALPNASSRLAPPRYLEPEAHQQYLSHQVSQFISAHLAESTTGN